MILSSLSNLQQRLILSFIGIIVLLIVITFSYSPALRFLFAFFTAGFIGAALWEYYSIAKAKDCQPLIKIGIIGTLFYVLAVFLKAQFEILLLPEIVLGLILISVFCYYFIKGSDPFVNLAITMFGILYITIPLCYLIKINYFIAEPISRDGRWCLIYLLAITKITDTSAFFIGKKYGRFQLSPYISPKKTWEGAFGGLLGAILLSILFYFFFKSFEVPPLNISFLQSLWLPFVISVGAQFGDLAESLLKRDVGVKDSSRLPGLGGMLDIVDSLIFTSPLMYFFLKMNAENTYL